MSIFGRSREIPAFSGSRRGLLVGVSLNDYTMALALGLDQRSVHECSRAVLQRQLSRYARVIPQWEPPRFKAAVSEGEKPVIPSASVFESRGSDPRKTPQRGGPDGNQLLPSAAECATHLQLLEAFQVLKEKVMKSNALDCAFKLKRNLGYFLNVSHLA